MATVTVTLVKDCWIAGVKQTAGNDVTVERSLAGELISSGIAAKPATWDSAVAVGTAGLNVFVSAAAPSDADGRPDGTIYIQTA